MQNFKEKWEEALNILKSESTAVSYNTWIQPIKVNYIENDTIYLNTTDELSRNMLTQRYFKLLSNTISQVFGENFRVSIEVGNTEEEKVIKSNESLSQKYNLNPKYLFDNFIIGNSNRMAYAASLAVAEAPSEAYNPLFLYGGVGLGKTHLMHSIGNFIAQNNKDAKILYVSSEKFTNELIQAIQYNKNEEFRNKYRNIDVLLIDDIQFITGKERTQEEFFHTFNTLHEANKQIIISSDRPPREIETLEERLRSRFEMGLIADIQAPDLETRMAILRQKAISEGYEDKFSNEILLYLANTITSNIRQLEGAINRIIAMSALKNQEITLELTKDAIKEITAQKPSAITIDYIQEIVADYYSLSISDFKTKKRNQSIVFPRQIAMYLSRKLTETSLPKIGDHFGGRDHTTIMHAIDKISNELKINPDLQTLMETLENKIKVS